MKNLSTDRPALILIDIQKGFDFIEYWGQQRNNPTAEEKASELLELWRQFGLPVFHIRHCSVDPASPLHESNPGNEHKEIVMPVAGELTIKKTVNSAFICTDLKAQLDISDISTLVIAGLTTDHCVSTTTRMAANFGFNAYVISDATATFNRIGLEGQNYPAELIHITALASLNNEFAKVVTSDFIKRNI